MGEGLDQDMQASPASDGKAPRTARGERTLRKILDAARYEFGEHGFSDSSIVGITQRAGVALGTFYTYFDSKEAVFQASFATCPARCASRLDRRLGRHRTRSTASAAHLKPSSISFAITATSTGSLMKPSLSTLPPIASIMKRP